MVDRALRDYLTHGGYPEAQGVETRERFELLRGYVDTAMLRDVVERHGVSQPVALRWMIRHLLGNAGGTFSIVPEPATLTLLALGPVALLKRRR